MRFHQVLAKMKADLEEYALNPKASEAAIAYRNDLIARLNLYGEIVENTIATLIEEKDDAYSKGYYAGYHTAHDEIKQVPNKYVNREQFREYNKLKAIQDFPNLY